MRRARRGSRLWPREWLEGFRVLLAFVTTDNPDTAARAPGAIGGRHNGLADEPERPQSAISWAAGGPRRHVPAPH
jgi:hypothetical protein